MYVYNNVNILSMNYIVGLGNPEDQYVGTRHNIGREIVEKFSKIHKFPDFEFDKKLNALITEGKIGSGRKAQKVTLILPETYMNKSGIPLKKLISSAKKAEKLIVVQDDLDMGFGTGKIVFGRGSAGHRGIDSIIKAIGTNKFARMKIGISPMGPVKKDGNLGKIKKPVGEEKVVKFVLGKFSPKEQDTLKKIIKKSVDGLEEVLVNGRLVAMNKYN
jgi:PTH1 family peptidyl-tRNA hydrolase